MKSFTNRAGAIVLAAALAVPITPLAAGPRQKGRGGDDPPPIIRIIKKIQKIFGITTHEDDDQPVPPRP